MAEERVDVLLNLLTKIEGSNEALSYLKQFSAGLLEVGEAFGVFEVLKAGFDITKAAAEAADKIVELSAEANMTADAFQTLTLNAQRFGVTAEEIVHGSVHLRDNLQKAAEDGASPLNKALETLNVTAIGLQAIAPERQFEVLGERIEAATDKEAAFAAALELLGKKNGPKLLEFLKALGVQGFDKLAESVNKFKLSEQQTNSLDHLWLRLKDLDNWSRSLGQKAVAAMANAIDPPLANLKLELDEMEARIAKLKVPQTADEKNESNLQRLDVAGALLKEGGEQNVKLAKEIIDRIGDETTDGIKSRVTFLLGLYNKAMGDVEKRAADIHKQDMVMAAAENAAQQARIGASGQKIGEKVEGDLETSKSKAIDKVNKSLGKQSDEMQRLAEHYREIADPAEKFRQEMFMVSALLHNGYLTAEEAAKAIDNLKVAMGNDLQKAIDASNNALLVFQKRLDDLDNNQLKTDVQKREERVKILKEENAAIEAQVALLKQFGVDHPGVDQKQIGGQVNSLGKKEEKNSKDIGKPGQVEGFRANFDRDLVAMQNHLHTFAENAAKTISGTIGDAFASVDSNLKDIIMSGESWRQGLEKVVQTIEGDLLSGVIHMFTTWIEQRALAGITSMEWSAKEGETDAAAKAPGAALASISSYGIAAAIGVAALVAAMAAFGGFYEGGYTGDIDTNAIAGVVHGGEYVFDAANTSRLGIGFLNAIRSGPGPADGGSSLGMAPIGPMAASVAGLGPVAANAQKSMRVAVLDHRDQNLARRMANDPEYNTQFVKLSQKNAGKIGIPVTVRG